MRNLLVAGTVLVAGGIAASATAQTFDFSADPFGSFGTGTLESFSNSVTGLKFSFTATDPGCCSGLGVSGFAFEFDSSVDVGTLGLENQDPSPVDFSELTNLSPIPNPFNSSTVSGSDFNFGVTNDPSGQNFSQSEPSLGAGDMDMFVITGVTDPSLVENIGVRIQACPETSTAAACSWSARRSRPRPTAMESCNAARGPWRIPWSLTGPHQIETWPKP